MLAYIPAPWILWVIETITEFGMPSSDPMSGRRPGAVRQRSPGRCSSAAKCARFCQTFPGGVSNGLGMDKTRMVAQ